MAASIVTSPSNSYLPAYNEIIYVIDSNKKTESNFSYVCDVYVSGITNPSYIRLKTHPHPTLGYGVFDISRVLRQYVYNDFPFGTEQYAFQCCTNNIKTYTAKFGEEFGLSTTGTTVYPDQTTSGLYAFNQVLDQTEYNAYLWTNYLVIDGSQKDFLTDAPTTQKIGSSEAAWLYYRVSTGATRHCEYAEIKTYNSSSSLIQTVQVQNAFRAIPSDSCRYQRFACGTSQLNSIPSAMLLAGSQSIITASVVKYTIQMYSSAGNVSSKLYTYEITDQCTKADDRFRFHFLNKHGGFDSFTFFKGYRHGVQIDRKSFKKTAGLLTSSGGFTFANKQQQNIDVYVSMSDNITCVSDWLTQDEASWLEDLVTSPVVYLEDGSDIFPVVIKDTNYNKRKDATDKIFNLEITWSYTFERRRQNA